MSSPKSLPHPKNLPSNGKSSDGSDGIFSRRMQLEITLFAIIAVLIFLAAIILPTGDWLELALQDQSRHIDDIIVAFFAESFVLVVFLFRAWRTMRWEASERANVVEQMKQRANIETQLSQMTGLLHACFTLEEASPIISHFARQLFFDHIGVLYVFRNSRNLLEPTVVWGKEESNEIMFGPQECWALRQGQTYQVIDSQSSILCGHVHHDRPYTCVPMMAHGEVLALLHISPNDHSMMDKTSTDAQSALLRVFTESIALAVSNLKLRESLRQQSIRDPLTGLFNRRYLEETLAIESERARRAQAPFSIIMLDLDHFKLFNDTHGHDAGDAVLQTLGNFLQRHVRGGDIACRYGGEEFTLILPGISVEAAQQRAQQLCEGIRALHIDFKNQILGPLTLSVGIATFPDHGQNGGLVLQAADAALYQAKNEGRDRVIVAV